MGCEFKHYGKMIAEETGEVLSRMDDSNVQESINIIKNSNRIVCLAGGREGLALKFFAMRLMHLGKDAHWALDDTCPALNKGDAFICSGSAGLYNHVMYIAEQVKKTGASIIVTTAAKDSPLAKLADQIIYIPAFGFHCNDASLVQSKQIMGNLFEQAQVLVYDAITMMLRDQMGLTDQNMEMKHRNFE